MASRGFLGAGDLYMEVYNATTGLFNAPTGPYEATKFEVAPKSDIKEMSSKGRTTYGQVIESVPLPQPAEFSIALPEVNRESLLLALLGTSTVINDAGGTITDEVMVAKKGSWVKLTKQNFAAAGFVVKNSGGTTTYVLGTDYDVNWALGWVKILEASAIVDGASLNVTGTYNARTGSKISGATNAQLRARFTLHGVNFADGLPCIVTVHEAILAASSAFDFLADDFASIEMSGKLKTPVGKTEPFTVEMLDLA